MHGEEQNECYISFRIYFKTDILCYELSGKHIFF